MKKILVFSTFIASALFLVSCSGQDILSGEGIDFFWIVASFFGGIFGATFSGNMSFGFTGVLILIGIPISMMLGNTYFMDYIAFGPLFGPHVSFAGGAAAAAYAAKKGYDDSVNIGRAVSTPLAGLDKPDVLLVGGLFGMIGYIIVEVSKMIPWFGSHTDNVALAVFTSGILARILFGKKTKSFISFDFSVNVEEGKIWLPWQYRCTQIFVISLAAAVFASVIGLGVINLEGRVPTEQYTILKSLIQTIPFGISALCIFFVSMGYKYPVTHQVTLIACLATIKFYPMFNDTYITLLVGTAFGLFAGFGVEVIARMFYKDGDTHIDPPAGIIWISTTLIFIVMSLCGL